MEGPDVLFSQVQDSFVPHTPGACVEGWMEAGGGRHCHTRNGIGSNANQVGADANLTLTRHYCDGQTQSITLSPFSGCCFNLIFRSGMLNLAGRKRRTLSPGLFKFQFQNTDVGIYTN